jgi:hypothetical protein
MAKQLECAGCNKHMGDLRDASVRQGMVVYCCECDAMMQTFIARTVARKNDVPDFMRTFFGGFNER